MTTIEEVTALRFRLLAAGFTPIPLYGKEPPIYGKNNKRKGFPGWQKLVNVTREMIEMWARTWPDAVNTGVLTRTMPTLDGDIAYEDGAVAIEGHIRELFEESGPILVRIGRPPKRAVPFRSSEPFDKITVNLIAPNGDEEKIEFLGDGQQVVVAGIHPDTGLPYRWFGGEPGPIAREELPYIREAEAQKLVSDIVDLLIRDFGYKRAATQPGRKRVQDLADNIRAGRALHDSLRDLAAKLVASGMGAGAAIEYLRELMKSSKAPRDERWQDRLDDIPRLVESAGKFAVEEPPPAEDAELPSDVRIDDFVAYLPMHNYVFLPTGEPWPAKSVNVRLPPVPVSSGNPIPASSWLDVHAPVEQMTWAPGEPALIKDRLSARADGYRDQAAPCSTSIGRHGSYIAAPPARRRGLITSAKSIPTMPTASSGGSPTACSDHKTKSTTRWCSAASKELGKTA
jgi:hypothetical protein